MPALAKISALYTTPAYESMFISAMHKATM